MKVLSMPVAQAPEPPRPSWWATFGKPHGTVVEHEGHVWRLVREGDDYGRWCYWEYVSTFDDWWHAEHMGTRDPHDIYDEIASGPAD